MNKSRRFMYKLLHEDERAVANIWLNITDDERIMRWAGYQDVDELEYLGGGADGHAWRYQGNRVFKLTKDRMEALASNRIANLELPNVNQIYKVGEVPEDISPAQRTYAQRNIYAIVQDYLPGDLDAHEAHVVDVIGMNIVGYGPDTFLDHLVEKGLIEVEDPVSIAWEDPDIREAFVNFLTERDELESETDMELVADVLRGLAALRQAGVGFADVHAGNVRKDSEGRYTLLDIGRSATRFSTEPQVIERLHIDGDLDTQFALIERIAG